MRRYRNLHPTFSKVPALPSLFVYARTYSKLQQIHKIPGTAYASSSPQTSSSLSTSPAAHVRGLATQGGDWDAERELGGALRQGEEGELELEFSATDGDANFKAKMEALHDPTSTNLYMEGWVFFWVLDFGFLGFGSRFLHAFSLRRFFLLFSLCRFLCCFLWAIFFVLPFSLRCFLWTVVFRPFSLRCFLRPVCSLTSYFFLCSFLLSCFLPVSVSSSRILALLTLFFCLITFSFLGSWVFCGPFSSCFFLSVVLFVLFSLVRFLCFLRPFCFVSLLRSFYSPRFLPVFVSSFPEFSPC